MYILPAGQPQTAPGHPQQLAEEGGSFEDGGDWRCGLRERWKSERG